MNRVDEAYVSLYGDVNCDSRVDITDAVLLNKVAAGAVTLDTPEKQANADCDANGEVDGKDYHFLSRERFVELRDQGHFAEWAEVHGNFYGTPLPPVREMLAKGQDILFDIDVQGAAQLRKNMPDARFLFILPPSMEELERRLRGRGLDSEEVILRRLANARAEMQEAPHYDALIVNDDLDTAYDHLRAAYLAATLAPHCRPGLVEALNNGHLL